MLLQAALCFLGIYTSTCCVRWLPTRQATKTGSKFQITTRRAMERKGRNGSYGSDEDAESFASPLTAVRWCDPHKASRLNKSCLLDGRRTSNFPWSGQWSIECPCVQLQPVKAILLARLLPQFLYSWTSLDDTTPGVPTFSNSTRLKSRRLATSLGTVRGRKSRASFCQLRSMQAWLHSISSNTL